MKGLPTYGKLISIIIILIACNKPSSENDKSQHMSITKTASQILGDSNYQAISYGGYRDTTREIQPTIEQLKDDMKILSAMGIKVLRTYNVQLTHAQNVLQAIEELRSEHPDFEMYVMLGAWIDCQNAWTETSPNHEAENEEANSAEIARAVDLANKYPNVVKIIAVGNEAMVRWAHSYYVQPRVILKWVSHLQSLKSKGKLNPNIWITSSDNFASWGGDSSYHCADLEELIHKVDFVSLHTYPMHDTHYNPVFWGVFESELHLPKTKAIKRAMRRAQLYTQKQYFQTCKYIHSIDSTKPVHIGETGWASEGTGHYGTHGSKACDEYKAGIYYQMMRRWTKKAGITCFYFEAFNEKWKDPHSKNGSENHFGLFKIKGEAKYAVWDFVRKGTFTGLTRGGRPITMSFNGDLDSLLTEVELPPVKQLR